MFNIHDTNNEEKNEDSLATSFMDNKVLRIMGKMGYKIGSGLGKNEQGITDVISFESNFGKRGLGLYKINESTFSWDFDNEDIVIEEKIKWLKCKNQLELPFETLRTYLKEGFIKNIDNGNFCDQEIFGKIIELKNIFDKFNLSEIYYARAKANPFESLRCMFFMNRAALKMANIDAATNFLFSNVDQQGCHRNGGPFYFADVCAGPGGFSEYILWRKKWMYKGFGLTLRGENDFKLHESTLSCSTFQPLYGYENDGNVYSPANIQDFKEKVLFGTENKGVHFMMSDGGFSVEGQENMQEILSRNIYVCQCLVALEIVRTNGHFVTKLFDIFTTFSIGLIYLMYLCFDKVGVLKPNSSRPANAERYLVCSGLKSSGLTDVVRDYLRLIVQRMWELRDNDDMTITELFSLNLIEQDADFKAYIIESNNRIGSRQIQALKKLQIFCSNTALFDYRQEDLRQKCLQYWKIPDLLRTNKKVLGIEEFVDSTINQPEFLCVHAREITDLNLLDSYIENVDDWRYCFLQGARENTGEMYAATSDSRVLRFKNCKWTRVKNLRLPKGTLLYGEIVKENDCCQNVDSDEKTFNVRFSLHVIDAIQLGDQSLAGMIFTRRKEIIEKFCKSVNREFQLKTVKVRSKEINSIESFEKDVFQKLDTSSYSFSLIPLGFRNIAEFYETSSVIFLKCDESQSFTSTFILRLQLCFRDSDLVLSLNDVQNYFKNRLPNIH